MSTCGACHYFQIKEKIDGRYRIDRLIQLYGSCCLDFFSWLTYLKLLIFFLLSPPFPPARAKGTYIFP